ncbi:hypothetical protein [Vibrio owensii]|uniref:hypothetical protein n=1 Tax=Vibrio harveyi group TaxID=717610 RepID=UPI003CC6B228
MVFRRSRNNETDQGRSDGLENHGDVPSSMPQQIMYGYYAHIKKKDLINYLDAKAKKSLAADCSFYNVVPYKDGFLWELHEGGSGKGALHSLKAKLGAGDEPITIKSASGGVRVTKNNIKATVDCFKLSDEDDLTQTSGISFRDNMTPVVNKGFGLFVTGTILFSLSVLSFFLAALFKFVLFNNHEMAEVHRTKITMPITAYERLLNVGKNDDRIYARNLYLERKEWKIKKASAAKSTSKEDLPEEIRAKLEAKPKPQPEKEITAESKEAALLNALDQPKEANNE